MNRFIYAHEASIAMKLMQADRADVGTWLSFVKYWEISIVVTLIKTIISCL